MLATALSIIQQGMLRINPRHVIDSVNAATEMLGAMPNTHKRLLEDGVEIKKRLESQPASKKEGIFRRPRSASLGDIPKKLTKGSSTRRSGRGQKFQHWFRRGPSKLGTLTRPLGKKMSCLSCAWH